MTVEVIHVDFANKVECVVCGRPIPRYWNEPVSGYCNETCFTRHMKQQMASGQVLHPYIPLQISRLFSYA